LKSQLLSLQNNSRNFQSVLRPS